MNTSTFTMSKSFAALSGLLGITLMIGVCLWGAWAVHPGIGLFVLGLVLFTVGLVVDDHCG